jgi:hypothetical protein
LVAVVEHHGKAEQHSLVVAVAEPLNKPAQVQAQLVLQDKDLQVGQL